MNPYTREKIENWIADFLDSTEALALPPAVAEHAAPVLLTLLVEACRHGDVEPDEVTESDLRSSLVNHVSRLALPDSAKSDVPLLCRTFLEHLEHQGRLAGGAELGRYTGALHVAFDSASAERVRPIENVATKLGRNDPCPCGSGKKYKKCCMNL